MSLCLGTSSGFLNFHVSHLNYKKFNLCLQNTLNTLKTTKVYFGVLQKYMNFNIETELFAGITIGCGICSPTSEVQHPTNRFAASHFPYVKPFTCESREELAVEAGHFPSFTTHFVFIFLAFLTI